MGLTILAFGTDLPELVVSVNGAIRILHGIESSGVIVGNAVGSSLCQVSLVLGITVMCHQMTADPRQWFGMAFGLLGSCVLLFLVGLSGSVGRPGGIVLVLAFCMYLIVLYRQEREGQSINPEASQAPHPIWMRWILVVGGLGLVILSSELVLEKALHLVETWGLRQSFVGAVIVAFGTSLPELALAVTAALKNKPGLSLGNIVGSNIFDCLVPIGVAAIIAPLAFDSQILWFDLAYLFMVSGLFTGFVFRRAGLRRREGVWMCLLYLGYVAIKLSLK